MDIDRIRADFPIFKRAIHGRPPAYLDNAATTQKPQVVLDRIAQFYSSEYANIHRGVHTLSEQASRIYEEARERVRAFLHARSTSEIIFTHGTTDGINLIAQSFGQSFVQPGDEIVITEMEHHSNIVPWQMLCRRRSAVLRRVPFGEDGRLDLDRYRALLGERTRLVAVTQVSNVMGVINPVKRMIRLARERSVPVLVDAAQAVQHLPLDVQDLGCDFLAFSGHKIYAGTGIGVLYGRDQMLEQLPPVQGGGGMVESVTWEEPSYARPPFRFEAGTPDFVGAAGLAAALTYIREIGIADIQRHERNLLDYALDRLDGVGELTIYGRPPERCGCLSFNLNGIHPYDAGLVLDKLGVAVRTGSHCAEPVMRHFGVDGMIRASFAIYNTEEDVDRLVEGLKRAVKMLG